MQAEDRLHYMDHLRALAMLAGVLFHAALAWPAAAQGWEPDVAAAEAWAAKRQGTVTFAVRTGDRLWGRARQPAWRGRADRRLLRHISALRVRYPGHAERVGRQA